MLDALSNKLWDRKRRGSIGIILLGNRPSNALTRQVCAGLRAEIAQMLLDNALEGIVVGSRLDQFTAGMGVDELIQPVRGSKAELAALCSVMDQAKKPIVVAINGACLGAGLELALAAPARVATPNAKFAFPETKFGLMPAAGTSYRLPRLIGPEASLDLLLGVDGIGADQAATIGLIDAITDADVLGAACSLAVEMARGFLPPRRDPTKDALDLQTAVLRHRQKLGIAQSPNFGKILDCVEASQIFMPDHALALEQAGYDALLFSDAVQGMCYGMVAQQRLRSAPQLIRLPDGAQSLALQQLNLLGQGDLVIDLCIRAAKAGLAVRLVDPNKDILMTSVLKISQILSLQVASGQLSAAARDAAWAGIGASTHQGDFDSSSVFYQKDSPDDPRKGDIELTLTPKPPRNGKAILILSDGGDFQYAIDDLAPAHIYISLEALFLKLGGRPHELDRTAKLAASVKDRVGQIVAFLQGRGHDRQTILDAWAAAGVATAQMTAPFDKKAILDPMIFGLANMGAVLLRHGVLTRAADFDAIALQTGLFPHSLGGPMFQADLRGPLVSRTQLRNLAVDAPDLFMPDPAFDAVIAKGRLFREIYGW